VVIHCAVEEALGLVVLDPAAVVVLWVTVLEVPVLGAAVLDAVAEVVLLVAVLGAAVLEVVAEVVLLGVVLAAPILAVVAGVLWVVGAGVCGVSVCARRIAAETKLQIRMIIERFIVHPFEGIERVKVSRP
jgi:hypothetical protein